jgi:predicted dehydrogenase
LGVPGVYDSVAEMFETTHAELVIIAVREPFIASVSNDCFAFPWTVLLEKPPGINLEVSEGIFAAAKAKGRKVLVGLNRRFLSSTRVVLADLAQAEGPRFIKVQDQQDPQVALAGGHSQMAVDNWMYCNSIHMIDYFMMFGRGKVKNVTPVFPWEPVNPWIVASKIEFDSGDTGLYEAIWDGPGPLAVTVSTGKKRWEMCPPERATFQIAGNRTVVEMPTHQWDQEYKPGFRLQAEMVKAAVLGEPSESPSLKEALETMRLINSIYRLQAD